MTASCPKCGGKGFLVENHDGVEVAVRCECQAQVSNFSLPPRYQHCYIKNFSTFRKASLKKAKKVAEQFVTAFPQVDYGLLFTGPCGVGKTHLAVGILQALKSKASNLLFCDYSQLCHRFSSLLSPESNQTMEDIFQEYLHAPLVLLDDLGSIRATPWLLDVVYSFINRFYLERRILLITTHYPLEDDMLAGRLSVPLVSRLLEMCRVVPLEGGDHRRDALQTGLQYDEV